MFVEIKTTDFKSDFTHDLLSHRIHARASRVVMETIPRYIRPWNPEFSPLHLSIDADLQHFAASLLTFGKRSGEVGENPLQTFWIDCFIEWKADETGNDHPQRPRGQRTTSGDG